jgi:hypothetical protein
VTKIELKAFRVTLEARQSERVQRFSEREYSMNNLERNCKRLGEVRSALRRTDGTPRFLKL